MKKFLFVLLATINIVNADSIKKNNFPSKNISFAQHATGLIHLCMLKEVFNYLLSTHQSRKKLKRAITELQEKYKVTIIQEKNTSKIITPIKENLSTSDKTTLLEVQTAYGRLEYIFDFFTRQIKENKNSTNDYSAEKIVLKWIKAELDLLSNLYNRNFNGDINE